MLPVIFPSSLPALTGRSEFLRACRPDEDILQPFGQDCQSDPGPTHRLLINTRISSVLSQSFCPDQSCTEEKFLQTMIGQDTADVFEYIKTSIFSKHFNVKPGLYIILFSVKMC